MKPRELSPEKKAKYLEWRRAYNSRPDVKAKSRQYMEKYLSRPEIQQKVREYNKNYMKKYWKTHPESYSRFKSKVNADLMAKRKLRQQSPPQSQG